MKAETKRAFFSGCLAFRLVSIAPLGITERDLIASQNGLFIDAEGVAALFGVGVAAKDAETAIGIRDDRALVVTAGIAPGDARTVGTDVFGAAQIALSSAIPSSPLRLPFTASAMAESRDSESFARDWGATKASTRAI